MKRYKPDNFQVSKSNRMKIINLLFALTIGAPIEPADDYLNYLEKLDSLSSEDFQEEYAAMIDILKSETELSLSYLENMSDEQFQTYIDLLLE